MVTLDSKRESFSDNSAFEINEAFEACVNVQDIKDPKFKFEQ